MITPLYCHIEPLWLKKDRDIFTPANTVFGVAIIGEVTGWTRLIPEDIQEWHEKAGE